MRFCLLGPLEVRDDQDHPVRIGEGRQRSVLVLLLLHRNERIASEWLVDALWGGAPPATAAKILQNHVAQLRRGLGDREGRRLQTHGRAYALRVEPGELDVERSMLSRRSRAAHGSTSQATARELRRAGSPERLHGDATARGPGAGPPHRASTARPRQAEGPAAVGGGPGLEPAGGGEGTGA